MYGARITILPLGRAILLRLGVLFLVGAFTSGAQPTAASPSEIENVRLSDPSSGFPLQLQPQLVVDGQGRVFVGWQEFSSLPGNGPVGFARSMDGGVTWSRSLVARTPSGNSQANPWLATDELDRLYLARSEWLGALVSRSDDGGATWGALADAHDGNGYPVLPSIKSDENGAVYVAYSNAPLNDNIYNWKIQVARSLDGGATWSAPKVLGTGLNLLRPLIATRPDGKVFVVWWAPGANFENIMFSASSDRGETWRAPVRVNPLYGTAANNNFHAPAVPYPSLVTNSSGSVFVAWADVGRRPGFGPRDGLNSDILISRSGDDGATWSAPVRINDTPAGDQWTVALAIDSNDTLHAAWYDTRTGGVNLYYASSTDGGATWSPNLKVTSQETPQASIIALGAYIGLAADSNGAAYMAWTDWRNGSGAIYFARTSVCSTPSAPAAANNGPIRVGETLQLTASAVAGATYSWSGPNEFHSSLQNPSIANVTTAASGTYSVIATVGGCTSVPATTNVTVLPGSCPPGAETLCLNSNRFAVQVDWRVPSQGRSGTGAAVPLTSDTGHFWFFSSNNIELVIKVVDGRAFNGFFWVFYGALSDVEYTVTVTDMATGAAKTYFNPQGELASVADTSAFAASGGADPPSAASLRSREPATASDCAGDPTTLCLNATRFRVQVAWRSVNLGASGAGQAAPLTSDTGYFWFFSDSNVELVIKVVDGRPVNGHFWVFYGALSDVEYTITVSDTLTGAVKTYVNPQGRLASVADTEAF